MKLKSAMFMAVILICSVASAEELTWQEQMAQFNKAVQFAEASVNCLQGDLGWVIMAATEDPDFWPVYHSVKKRLDSAYEVLDDAKAHHANAWHQESWFQKRGVATLALQNVADRVKSGYTKSEPVFAWLEQHPNPMFNQAERVSFSVMPPYDYLDAQGNAEVGELIRRNLEEDWELD